MQTLPLELSALLLRPEIADDGQQGKILRLVSKGLFEEAFQCARDTLPFLAVSAEDVAADQAQAAIRFVDDGETEELRSERRLEVLGWAAACVSLFVQANWTGPAPNVPWSPTGKASAEEIDPSQQRLVTESLERDGEFAYPLMNLPLFLKTAVETLVLPPVEALPLSWTWWQMRACTLHQQALSGPSPQLREQIERCFEVTFRRVQDEIQSEQRVEVVARLHLERAAGAFFHKDDRALNESVKAAQTGLGLKVELTGELGVRTKFQTFKVSQLICKAEPAERVAGGVETTGREVKTIGLDEADPDTILLEQPKLESEGDSEAKLNSTEQCVVLWLSEALSLEVRDKLSDEEQLAYVATASKGHTDWLVYTTALLLKSRIERKKPKTWDRALLQIQVLVDQFMDADPPVADRCAHFFSLPFPSRWQMRRELATALMNMGVAKTALKIFEELEMWEEAVTCLRIADEIPRALAVVRRQLETRKEPNLLCVLGELTGDDAPFHEAWEVSRHRCARAKRTLGRRFFRERRL